MPARLSTEKNKKTLILQIYADFLGGIYEFHLVILHTFVEKEGRQKKKGGQNNILYVYCQLKQIGNNKNNKNFCSGHPVSTLACIVMPNYAHIHV